MEKTELEATRSAPIVAVYEGLLLFKKRLEEFRVDLKDEGSFYAALKLAVYALYAEAFLGRLLIEYKKQAIASNECMPRPNSIDKRTADEAVSFYKYEEFIVDACADAAVRGKVLTKKMVIMKGKYKRIGSLQESLKRF